MKCCKSLDRSANWRRTASWSQKRTKRERSIAISAAANVRPRSWVQRPERVNIAWDTLAMGIQTTLLSCIADMCASATPAELGDLLLVQ